MYAPGSEAERQAAQPAVHLPELGHLERDDAEAFAAEILAKEKPGDPIAELYQGGMFCVLEEVPNPAAPPKKVAKKVVRKKKK